MTVGAQVALAKVQTQQTPGGAMRVLLEGKLSKQLLPLADTKARARITGYVAQVAVVQRFNNPFKKSLEAVYVFPLPQNAAVSSMRIRIGSRTITSVIKSRAEARKIYEKAKRSGKTVARIDQQRANIFTQRVANIAPGKAVTVELVYDVELRQSNGIFEFVYPMVVGPRYIPGTPTGKPTKGAGRSPDTNRVPDASRITPPILKPGARSGHTIGVQVTIDPGVAMKPPTSPTHKIVVTPIKDAKRPYAVKIKLAKGDRIPNKDLVVRYRLASTKTSVASIAHRGKHGGFFTLVVHPPGLAKASHIAARDMVFVLDTTGSMAGEPLAMIKRAMRFALRSLNAKDTFQIVLMATGKVALSSAPLANTPANVRRALSYVNGISAGGSGDLLTGVRAGLTSKARAGRTRVVCLMTDGFVGNDAEILAAVTKLIGPRTRLFPIGVGSSVNRSLLARMAYLGRGAAHYMLLGRNPTKQVIAFYKRIRSPVLTNISIDFKGLAVKDVSPSPIPDVFAGRPLRIIGRYDRAGEATIKISGTFAGKSVSFPVPLSLPSSEDGHEALARLWARARIRQRMAFTYGKRTTADTNAIRTLATKFGIVSKFTSLVAADKRAVNAGGKVRTYYVPVEMPKGVSYGSTLADGGGGSITTAITKPPPTVDPTSSHGGGSNADGDREIKKTSMRPAPGDLSVVEVRASARRIGRWHFELGLSSGVVSEESPNFGNQAQVQLNFFTSRVLRPSLRLGLDATVFLPGLDTDAGGSHLLIRSGYLGLLRGRLELGGGVGLSLPFNDKVGFAFLATGMYRLRPLGPILPSLQIRYEGHHVPSTGKDQRSFTIGAGFGF